MCMIFIIFCINMMNIVHMVHLFFIYVQMTSETFRQCATVLKTHLVQSLPSSLPPFGLCFTFSLCVGYPIGQKHVHYITTSECRSFGNIPSMPSLIFFKPLSFKTSFATSLFSKYLKNLCSLLL